MDSRLTSIPAEVGTPYSRRTRHGLDAIYPLLVISPDATQTPLVEASWDDHCGVPDCPCHDDFVRILDEDGGAVLFFGRDVPALITALQLALADRHEGLPPQLHTPS